LLAIKECPAWSAVPPLFFASQPSFSEQVSHFGFAILFSQLHWQLHCQLCFDYCCSGATTFAEPMYRVVQIDGAEPLVIY
jgi:hypothetical protein